MAKAHLKITPNSDKFRGPAIFFQKNEYYITAPPGTTEYIKYWTTEAEYCINGYTAEDGDRISGYNYFYLNYFPIDLVKSVKVNGSVRAHKKRDFPAFYDYDRFYFDAIEEAEIEGNHMVVLKARRKGYSYKVASMLNRNFYFIRNSKNFALAAEAEFLIKDGILDKAWDAMSFIDSNTAWYKKRQKKDTKMHKRSSYVQKDDTGVEVELGYMSEIIGVTLKNDPNKARGKCFGKGTKVLMADGSLRNIEDIKLKDKVMGPDSKPREVLSLHTGIDNLYKISPSNGEDQIVNSEHDIYCNFLNHRFEDTGSKLIKPLEYKGLKKTMQARYKLVKTGVEFENKEVPLDPYYLGLWLGDGSKRQPTITTKDIEILKYIKEFSIKEGCKYNVYHILNNPEVVEVTTNGGNTGLRKNKIKSILDSLKVLNNKHIPEIYLNNSRETRLKLLAGLIDTDGYYDFPNGRFEIIQKLKSLSEQIVYLSRSLGFKTSINEKYIEGYGIYYRMNILSGIEEIPTLIKRKQAKHKNKPFVLNPLHSTFKLEDYGKGEYFGFTVDGDNLFLLGDFTISHNSGKIIIFEEAGKFRSLLHAWQIARPSVEQGSHVFGMLIAFGTGGVIGEDFEGLRELFEKPKGYNCLAFNNIWDDDAIGQQCGFFIPQYANMEGVYENKEDPKDPYNGIPFMDKDGNTDVPVSRKYILLERQKVIDNASDKRSIDRHMAEQPIYPREALLDLSTNIFPKVELQKHLANIRNDKKLKNFKQVGNLRLDKDTVLRWEPTLDYSKQKDIVKYRLDPSDDPSGQTVIWEHPVENPPYGLYIAGCLTPGEKVLTDKGLQNVEDVKKGDKLINKEGKLVDIINFQIREKVDHDTFKFKMSNTYRTTTFTRGHPLYISSTGYNSNKTINEDKFDFKFTRADKVKTGDWTKWPNVYRSKNDFDINEIWKKYKSTYKKIDNPLSKEDFWWFIGLWLGDGCCYNNKVSIAFNKGEVYYINKARSIIENIINRSPQIYNKGENIIEISFNSKQLCTFLTDNFGKYSYGKYISEWVKRLDIRFKMQLLWGYLASDGCITIHTKGYYSTEFVSVSLKLLEDFQDILFSTGIVSGLSKMRDAKKSIIKDREVTQKDTFHLRLSHHSTLGFVENIAINSLEEPYYDHSIYDDPKVRQIDFKNLPDLRKRSKDGCFVSKDKKYIYFQIKDIEHSLYTGNVYNFECDTHNYISHHISQKNCDPYDHDKSGTNSLGSIFIFKRFQTFENYYDLPVAEYTGRPETAEQFYEQVRLLLKYYSATLLYENEKKGLFFHFDRYNSLHLLADQPDGILKDIIKDSKVQRGKGIHMNTMIKDWGEGAIRDWLVEEYEPGVKNLTKIMSEPLLEELIYYNDKGNFDRVISFMLVMIFRQELHKVHVKDKSVENKNRQLFPDGGPFASGNFERQIFI